VGSLRHTIILQTLGRLSLGPDARGLARNRGFLTRLDAIVRAARAFLTRPAVEFLAPERFVALSPNPPPFAHPALGQAFTGGRKSPGCCCRATAKG